MKKLFSEMILASTPGYNRGEQQGVKKLKP